MRLRAILLAFVFLAMTTAKYGVTEETIFNVPNGDILDEGKLYGEFDFTYLQEASNGTYTPRLVAGIAPKIEIGMNFNGISAPERPSQTTLTPTLKWKAYDGSQNGWSFVIGDDLFVPLQNRSYNVGNYVYAEFTKTLSSHTRFTFGAFDFTANVVASGNKAGGQFGFEQPTGKRVTLAADWFTGKHSAGYFTPGAIIKVTTKLTLYPAYEIGNSDVSMGNHLWLLEIGWNFN